MTDRVLSENCIHSFLSQTSCVLPLHLLVAALFGWLEREQRDVIEFLREENRVLKTQLHGRRLRLSDDERRRLAVIGHRLGRRVLGEVAAIVRPETILTDAVDGVSAGIAR